MHESLRMDVVEATQVSAARREVAMLAQSVGLDETDQGRLAIVVTEATTNLVKHARQGELIARRVAAFGESRWTGVEVTAIDRGDGLPGGIAFDDGFSTSGTAGNGLGAIWRQADGVDHSSSASGLVLCATVGARRQRVERPDRPRIGAICVSKPGEQVSGDGWALAGAGDGTWSALIVDGLGHGPLAADATRMAIAAFQGAADEPAGRLRRIHDALRASRGAAAGVARWSADTLEWCGIGNVVCRVLDDGHERQLVTHAGIVGHGARKFATFAARCGPGATVVLHTDGLNTRCAVGAHPGLERRDPSVVAGVLYRGHLRAGDDATVVVIRIPRRDDA